MTFSIRPLRPEDTSAVLALAASLDGWFNTAGLRQMERDLASHAGFVADRDGRLRGFVTWCALEPTLANVSWMGVVKEEHRRGIGRALLAGLVADLRARGFETVEVSTVADTVEYEPYARTRAFYRATGFEDHAVDSGYYGEPGETYDRLRLRLRLSE